MKKLFFMNKISSYLDRFFKQDTKTKEIVDPLKSRKEKKEKVKS